MGRWTSRDPKGEKGGLNLYVFVLNNTNIYFDPLGLDAESTFSQWIKTKPHKRVGLFRQRSMFSKELVRQGILFAAEFKTRLYYLENKGVNVDCLTICELDAEYLKERQGQFEKIGWLSALLIGGASRGGVKTSSGITGFTEAETAIINEARVILESPEMASIRVAYEAGESVTMNINGRIIQYEPGLNASGMTMFGEKGFVIGNQAFSNSTEITRTVLQELYRLRMSASAGGVSAELAATETQAAFEFAERACSMIKR